MPVMYSPLGLPYSRREKLEIARAMLDMVNEIARGHRKPYGLCVCLVFAIHATQPRFTSTASKVAHDDMLSDLASLVGESVAVWKDMHSPVLGSPRSPEGIESRRKLLQQYIAQLEVSGV